MSDGGLRWQWRGLRILLALFRVLVPKSVRELTSIPRAHREDDLANVDTGDKAIRLAKSSTHSSLQSIGTSARQHLVDADDMVWVGADTEVETFLASNLDEVLVGADAGGFESLGAQLFVLIGD